MAPGNPDGALPGFRTPSQGPNLEVLQEGGIKGGM